jgi:hypothetical protein
MTRWVRVLLALAFALGTAGTASADWHESTGLNLSWGDCGARGWLDQTFACDKNVGTAQAVASFIAPANVDSVTAGSAVIDIQQAGVAFLDSWWELQRGGCRSGGASATWTIFMWNATCTDPWHDTYPNGVTATTFELLGYTLRVRSTVTGCAGSALVPGDEYFGLYFVVNHLRTVNGYNPCAGCDRTACIAFNELTIFQPTFQPETWRIGGAPVGGRDFVTWQTADTPDCAAVPVLKRSWGQIKALYR